MTNTMRTLTRIVAILLLIIWSGSARHSAAATTATQPSLEAVLAGIEDRYQGGAFRAAFKQSSTLKAMDITDTANGRLEVKRPAKMRWTYESPDRQVIISNGSKLWIYRPDDRQVIVGKAPALFGDGRGASFLTDLARLREQFAITRADPAPTGGGVRLKLTPQKSQLDLAAIYVSVAEKTFEIFDITTLNAYGDETRIELHDIEFDRPIDDARFEFTVPPGVDVVRMDEADQ